MMVAKLTGPETSWAQNQCSGLEPHPWWHVSKSEGESSRGHAGAGYAEPACSPQPRPILPIKQVGSYWLLVSSGSTKLWRIRNYAGHYHPVSNAPELGLYFLSYVNALPYRWCTRNSKSDIQREREFFKCRSSWRLREKPDDFNDSFQPSDSSNSCLLWTSSFLWEKYVNTFGFPFAFGIQEFQS